MTNQTIKTEMPAIAISCQTGSIFSLTFFCQFLTTTVVLEKKRLVPVIHAWALTHLFCTRWINIDLPVVVQFSSMLGFIPFQSMSFFSCKSSKEISSSPSCSHFTNCDSRRVQTLIIIINYLSVNMHLHIL